MVECRYCRTVLPPEAEARAARCPKCRRPLYEKPEGKRRPPASAAGLGTCLVHPSNDAVGRCRHCQQLFCSICRTRWQDELVCLACLNQALEKPEATPRDVRMQRRQGTASLVLALLGWLLFAAGVAQLWSMREGRGTRDLAVLTVVLFLVSFVPALFSLGQASATIRSRGERVKAATWGLVLASLQLGITIGVILINIRHN
jgi:hypothetical protein